MRKQDIISTIWSSAKGVKTFGHCSIVLCTMLLAGLLTACSDSSGSAFPPLKLEFATAFVNALGEVDEMRLDDGRLLSLKNQVSTSGLTEGDSVRVVSYHEVNTENQIEVRVMKVAETVVPEVVTNTLDVPVELISVSQGLYHLNVVLGVQHTDAKKQFRMDPISYEPQSTLHLRLYYDTENYRKTYTERVYMSIPMVDYLNAFTSEFEIVVHWKNVKTNTEETLKINWR